MHAPGTKLTAAGAADATAGTLGPYDLLAKVGEGGAGTVYKARHRESGQIVAVKVAPPHVAGHPILQKRFEQEYRVARQCDHPNLVRALDYCNTDGAPYLVMEFVEGESLGERLERDGRLPEAEATRLIAEVCQGLHWAHQHGLVHRDIKPDNIVVTPDGQAKLIDLGLAKDVDTDLDLTRTGRGLGTPHFMAPEQFRNAKEANVQCDVYALGATLYAMVTGRLPFESVAPLEAWMKKIHNELTPARRLVPGLSVRTDAAIQRAMSGVPALRPASCPEFLADLLGTANSGSNSPPAPAPAPARRLPEASTPVPPRRSCPAPRPLASEGAAPPQALPDSSPPETSLIDWIKVLLLFVVVMVGALVAGRYLLP
jgi:serine/threonine protein kinase